MVSLIVALLLLSPEIASARGVCYTPSDCVAPEVCSSILNGEYPGRCVQRSTDDDEEGEFAYREMAPETEEEHSSSAQPASSMPPVQQLRRNEPAASSSLPPTGGEQASSQPSGGAVSEAGDAQVSSQPAEQSASSESAEDENAGEDEGFLSKAASIITDDVIAPVTHFISNLWCGIFSCGE